MDALFPFKIPANTVIENTKRIINCDGHIETIDGLRCKPLTRHNIIPVYRVGDNLDVTFCPTLLEKGVNPHAVHNFNAAFDVTAEDDAEQRHTESMRTSASRLRREIRELAGCNPWAYFATLTLRPTQWNRYNPEGIQAALSKLSTKWHRRQINGTRPWKAYAYLLIPEFHKDGAIHLHGLVYMIPDDTLIRYTMDDVNSDKPLPIDICKAVRAGEKVYRCSTFDEQFGYNMLTPIRDPNKVTSYIRKYITKDLCCDVFKTRFFHSRGLKRAEKIAELTGQSDPDLAMRFEELMAPMAIKLDNGNRLLWHEHIPVKGKADIVVTKVRINIREYPPEEVLKVLSTICIANPHTGGESSA